MRRWLLLAAWLTLPGWLASAEIIDRMIVVVGRHPLTELQLEEELKVTAFLNEQPVSDNLDARRAAVHRLVDQTLIQREMRLARFPAPSLEEVDSAFRKLQQQKGGEEKLSEFLSRYQLTPEEVRAHLRFQIEALRFIELRFRPQAGSQRNLGEAMENETDRAMDEWLEQARKQTRVEYIDPSLKDLRQ